jgi:hypothetical protein
MHVGGDIDAQSWFRGRRRFCKQWRAQTDGDRETKKRVHPAIIAVTDPPGTGNQSVSETGKTG